jgi:hypothetical protein
VTSRNMTELKGDDFRNQVISAVKLLRNVHCTSDKFATRLNEVAVRSGISRKTRF